MLSENQCKRLLKQCESAYKAKKEENLKGWVQALRLVLEVNGSSKIKNTPIAKEKNE